MSLIGHDLEIDNCQFSYINDSNATNHKNYKTNSSVCGFFKCKSRTWFVQEELKMSRKTDGGIG